MTNLNLVNSHKSEENVSSGRAVTSVANLDVPQDLAMIINKMVRLVYLK